MKAKVSVFNSIHSLDRADYSMPQFVDEFTKLWQAMVLEVYSTPFNGVECLQTCIKAYGETKYTPLEYLKHFLDPSLVANQIASNSNVMVGTKQRIREKAWQQFIESWHVGPPVYNKIVKIGCCGMFQCYLNVPVKEAIERAKASGHWFDDFDGFIIEEFTFKDEFESYDCYGGEQRQRYNSQGEVKSELG